MKNATLNYENRFYINNTPFSGITSVGGSYSINYAPINTVGVGYNKQVIAEVPIGQFTIDKYLLYNEPFLQFTGENFDRTAKSFRGSLNYNNKSFGFNSGYLVGFDLSCSVGEVPSTSNQIEVYGDIGSGITASGNIPAPYITVPQVKDINISCSGSSTNRITNFDYSISCPKKPIYTLNQPLTSSGPSGPVSSSGFNYIPSEVLLRLPIEINASFNLEVDDYNARKVYQQLNNDIDSNFSISIKGVIFEDQPLLVNGTENLTVNGGTDLLTYKAAVGVKMFEQSFNNMKLVSQEFNSNADDVLSVKLSYKGYLNN